MKVLLASLVLVTACTDEPDEVSTWTVTVQRHELAVGQSTYGESYTVWSYGTDEPPTPVRTGWSVHDDAILALSTTYDSIVRITALGPGTTDVIATRLDGEIEIQTIVVVP